MALHEKNSQEPMLVIRQLESKRGEFSKFITNVMFMMMMMMMMIKLIEPIEGCGQFLPTVCKAATNLQDHHHCKHFPDWCHHYHKHDESYMTLVIIIILTIVFLQVKLLEGWSRLQSLRFQIN